MKPKTKVLLLFTLGIIFLFFSIFNSSFSKNLIANSNYLEFNEKDQVQIKQSGFWNLTESPIYIDDSATGVGAHNWTWAETQLWCSGSGSWADPYVIENVTIDGQGSSNCIEIKNSDAYFIIRNCTVYNSGYFSVNATLKLNYVNNGKIISNNCSDNNNNGIYLSSSNNNTLSGNSASNNNAHGIRLEYSDNNTLSGNTANNNHNGIEIRYSDNNTLSGNTANNNHNGLELWYSDDNTLSGNTANYNYDGIQILYSDSTTLSGNTASNNNAYGIYLGDSNNNALSGNLMNFCSILLKGSLAEMTSHCIDDTNLVNNKPVYYYVNEIGLSLINFTNAGQIILINYTNSIISGLNISDGSGLYLYYSNNNTLSGNTASNNSDYGIYLDESNNNTLSGNTASNNSDYGIYLDESNNNTLSGNTASNKNYGGIYLRYSDNNTLSGNSANNNNALGIRLESSDNNTLSGNSASNHTYGIDLSNSDNNTLSGNIVNNNNIGIALDYSKNNELSGNLMNFCGINLQGSLAEMASHSIDVTNLVNNKPVYYYKNELGLESSNFTNAGQIILVNWSNSIISGLNISDGSGINLFYCDYNTISGNTASDNNKDGIHLYQSNNNTLSGNIVSYNNDHGINLRFSDNNTLSGNIASNNGDSGIYLSNSDNNTISGNIASDNFDDGICLYDSDNNILSGNTASDNFDDGICLWFSDNNTLSGNNANDNHNGLELHYSDNNTLSGNTVSNKNYAGIYLSFSDNNTLSGNIVNNNSHGISLSTGNNNVIYSNTLKNNNGGNAEDNGIDNHWDNGTIGNYWDDYSGVDVNHDGIGDTPYIVQGTAGSQDNFPIYDNIAPIITIIFPLPDSIFGLDPPNYNISIDERNLDSIWYTLDGGRTNYTITSLTGTFNQIAWEALSEGNLTIRFYASDNNDNIGFANATVKKDTAPVITIILPLCYESFDFIAPNYTITVDDLNLDTIWYTLDGGITNYTITGLAGMFNNIAWGVLSEGNITIRFYANDTAGNTGSAVVTIEKDINDPIISIISPLPNNVFGLVPPNYNISIDELNLDTIWYTLDGGLTNYTIINWTGTINQLAWETLSEGSVTIRFYAIDAAGNIGFKDVEIVKEIPDDPVNVPIISFGNYYILFTAIAILSFIILEKQKKNQP